MPHTDTLMSKLHNQIDHWLQAVKRGDLADVRSCYTDDVRAFDAVKQLEFSQVDYFTHWQQCLEFCQSHVAFELRDIQIRHDGGLAMLNALLYCAGTNDKGEVQGCWMRLTQGWQLQQGQWLIFHDHFSVPFDMVSGAALFNLMPNA